MAIVLAGQPFSVLDLYHMSDELIWVADWLFGKTVVISRDTNKTMTVFINNPRRCVQIHIEYRLQ